MPISNTYPISIYKEGMIKVADITAYITVSIQHAWKGYRTISLEVQTNVAGSEQLTPPNYIAITTPTGTYGGVIYKRSLHDAITQGGREQKLTIEACSPVGFFQKRYVLDYNSFDVGLTNKKYIISGHLETVAKQFIWHCTGGDYLLPDFRVAPDLERGDIITYQAKYASLYSIISNLFASNSILSYDVTFTEDNGFVFDVISAKDLSDTVILASEQNVFSSFDHDIDFLNSSNDVPMLADSEAFFLHPNRTTRGYNRHTEVVQANVDAGALEAAVLIYSLQNAYTTENPPDVYECAIRTDTQKYFFNSDYYLGDIINLYYKTGTTNINVQKRIYTVQEQMSKSDGYTIQIGFNAAHSGIVRTFTHIKEQIERSVRGV